MKNQNDKNKRLERLQDKMTEIKSKMKMWKELVAEWKKADTSNFEFGYTAGCKAVMKDVSTALYPRSHQMLRGEPKCK